ncbi:MAG: hypothetical protein J6Y89_02110 [Lachnospiraceae bacterium]|nr:hypothetical protein [Lachnospiraceae bacterium]
MRKKACPLIAAVLAVSLLAAGCRGASVNKTAEEGVPMEISKRIKIDISGAQTFNDTNSDGYGEFEGWGTSLCWWANRLGYSTSLTEQSAKAFFDLNEGLGMNIGRYNIGGGDNVTDPSAPFYHEPHIKRSDSEVPGYCKDVVKIDLTEKSKEYYEENYARADFECGYAWNYDWDADTNQMNILKAAIKAAGDVYIAEAFSNSPPYFMTVSGCSSGGEDPGVDNLREDSYTAFACYLADVIAHWKNEGLIFRSVAPMNEPATSYWKANSDKQEGCHFSMGESQSRILVELNKELANKGIDIIISASDETSIDTAAASFDKLSEEAKAVVERIDTHAYQGTQRSLLKSNAEKAGKNLWMSEVDGTEGLFSAGRSESGMQAALGFARAIITDLNGMKPTAWIMWDAVDIHVDSKNRFDTCSRKAADGIIANGTPFWGIGIADHDKEELLLGKKYYAFGQFTRYIRPGYCIVDSGENTVAAFNPVDKSIVIVAMNANTDDLRWEFDLSDFDKLDGNTKITAIRTSGSMADGENWADVSGSVNVKISEDVTKFATDIKGSSVTTFIIGK